MSKKIMKISNGVAKSKVKEKSKTKLPESFRYLFWSYRFSEIDPIKHKKTIISNILNHGDLEHWRWLIKTYGRKHLKEVIESIPASEFRKPIRVLLSLLLGIKFKYVSRSDKISAERNLQ